MVAADRALDLPKVLLHDHLDGGLRVSTVIDLAAEIGWIISPSLTPSACFRNTLLCSPV